MLAKLSVDQALMKAKSHIEKEVIEAKKLYEDILKIILKIKEHNKDYQI